VTKAISIRPLVSMYLNRVTDTQLSGQLFRLSGQLSTISFLFLDERFILWH